MITVDEGSRKKVLMVALAVVVAVAVAGAIYAFRQDASTLPPPPEEREAEESLFLCSKCEAEFTRTEDQLPPGYRDRVPVGPGAAIGCPQCGAAACAYPPRQCPNCKKLYLSDADLAPSGEQGPRATRCPHCGTVPYEWHRKHVKPGI